MISLSLQMTGGQKARRVVTPLALSVASYALSAPGTFNLEEFLAWLVTSAGAGTAIFAIIQYGQKWTNSAWNSDIKFYLAMVLSYLLPVGAYLGSVGLGFQEWDVALLIASVAVGYQTSQSVHFETPVPEAVADAKAKAQVEAITG